MDFAVICLRHLRSCARMLVKTRSVFQYSAIPSSTDAWYWFDCGVVLPAGRQDEAMGSSQNRIISRIHEYCRRGWPRMSTHICRVQARHRGLRCLHADCHFLAPQQSGSHLAAGKVALAVSASSLCNVAILVTSDTVANLQSANSDGRRRHFRRLLLQQTHTWCASQTLWALRITPPLLGLP